MRLGATVERLKRKRFLVQAGYDGLAWIPSLWAGALLRYELDVTALPVAELVVFSLMAVVLQVVIGRTIGL